MIQMKPLNIIRSSFIFSLLVNNDLAYAQPREYGPWHMMPGMFGGWGMGWVGMVFMFVFWGLVIAALFFLVKWLIQATRSGKPSDDRFSRAIDILKERYARGEIDKVEFQSKKRDLMD